MSQEIQIHSPEVGKKKERLKMRRKKKRKHDGRRNTMVTNLYDP